MEIMYFYEQKTGFADVPLRLFTDVGPHRSQWTHSPYLVAQVCDSFGNGCLDDLALAQGSQNSGFKSRSRSMPVIEFWVPAYCMAE